MSSRPTTPPQRSATPESTLKKVVNAPEVVKAFGRSYEIKRFSFFKMTQALDYAGAIVLMIQMAMELPRDKDGKVIATQEQIFPFVARSVSVIGPSVFGLVSVATQEPVEWLEHDDRDPMDGLRLFAKVVEKNLDFFTPENLKELTGILNVLPQTPIPGGEPSTNS